MSEQAVIFPPADAKEADVEENLITNRCDKILSLVDQMVSAATEEDVSTAHGEISKCIREIKSEAEELTDTIDNRDGEISDLKEHTSFGEAEFGDVKWSVQGLHHEQIMDALADAIEKGRPLHLLEYLQTYKSDLEK